MGQNLVYIGKSDCLQEATSATPSPSLSFPRNVLQVPLRSLWAGQGHHASGYVRGGSQVGTRWLLADHGDVGGPGRGPGPGPGPGPCHSGALEGVGGLLEADTQGQWSGPQWRAGAFLLPSSVGQAVGTGGPKPSTELWKQTQRVVPEPVIPCRGEPSPQGMEC